jgi:16S rRNA (cytosine967-C5)-methyltransferase
VATTRKSRIFELACAVIAKSSREHPADSVLRDELRKQRALSHEAAVLITRYVFSYYRWFGWLQKQQPLTEQLKRAVELANTFEKDPDSFSDSELLSFSVPAWVASELNINPAWARALQTEPALWLRARPGQGRALAQELGRCKQFGSSFPNDILRYSGTKDLFRTEAFQAGRFEIQDISSQAVGLICSPRPGEVWWDACSGEGGKTLHLSDLMENRGLIWASDRAAWRLQNLRRRAARARVFNYRAALWNGSMRLPTKTKFDGVLVDAPCTGIGTWHRNPHARWTTTLQDIQELSQLQKQLVSNAARSVKPGGKLFYAVCTLDRAETLEVVDAFEKKNTEFTPLEIRNPLDPQSNPSEQLWLWPQDHLGNGMFVAGWTRNW